MTRDPKFSTPERMDPAWVPLDQDALEDLAYVSHTLIEYDPAWGISVLSVGGTTYYSVGRKIGLSA